jgi:hypothetical protein
VSIPVFEPPEKGTKFTERRMLDHLHNRYGQVNAGNGPRWASAEHVKNQAGFFAGRCADFIAIDLWPGGDGCELHGHEVKVSRSDWLHELKQPDKAEAFKRYMDRWWLVVPDATIVKPGELPEGWGLLTLVRDKWPGRGLPNLDGHKLRAKIQAPKLTPEPLPREMLATLMRSTARTAKRRSHDAYCTADPCNHNPRWIA